MTAYYQPFRGARSTYPAHERHASDGPPPRHRRGDGAPRRDPNAGLDRNQRTRRARAAHMASDLKNVTRKWEEGNKVLGHVQKTNVARPRALLTVGDATSARDVDQKMPSRATCGSRGGPAIPGAGRCWSCWRCEL